jgi:hypothetical protein
MKIQLYVKNIPKTENIQHPTKTSEQQGRKLTVSSCPPGLLLHPYTSAKADKSTLHKVIIAR